MLYTFSLRPKDLAFIFIIHYLYGNCYIGMPGRHAYCYLPNAYCKMLNGPCGFGEDCFNVFPIVRPWELSVAMETTILIFLM